MVFRHRVRVSVLASASTAAPPPRRVRHRSLAPGENRRHRAVGASASRDALQPSRSHPRGCVGRLAPDAAAWMGLHLHLWQARHRARLGLLSDPLNSMGSLSPRSRLSLLSDPLNSMDSLPPVQAPATPPLAESAKHATTEFEVRGVAPSRLVLPSST